MIYALNVFNVTDEDAYRDYNLKAGKIIYGLGGMVLVSGWKPVRRLRDDGIPRSRFIVVEFPGEQAFDEFFRRAEETGLHAVREGSTADYIWTLCEPWDLKAWVRGQA
ncbi:MAG: DUF1330 domain-containing protein [Spirochaetes bacterium]|nr:MAG: DUF1330 domain-containing protein [Spirochaetota bacterium]